MTSLTSARNRNYIPLSFAMCSSALISCSGSGTESQRDLWGGSGGIETAGTTTSVGSGGETLASTSRSTLPRGGAGLSSGVGGAGDRLGTGTGLNAAGSGEVAVSTVVTSRGGDSATGRGGGSFSNSPGGSGGRQSTRGVSGSGGTSNLASGERNSSGGAGGLSVARSTGGTTGRGGAGFAGSGGVIAAAGSMTASTAGMSGSGCPASGHITYTLAKVADPTQAQQTAYDLITKAMDKAVTYYNCYTNITKALKVSYLPSIATADGNINGSVRFGSDTTYMNYRIAMHEISHTVGVGQVSNWNSFITNEVFTGANATKQLQTINAGLARPLYTEVHADAQHFWPYGEVSSEIDALYHMKMVVAIRADLGVR